VYGTVMYGGINPLPNVKATGDHAPALANLLRFAWPDHRVSRVDVAIDYRGQDAFDDTIALMGQVGRAHRLKGEKIIPDDLDDGSTYYLGARAAALRVRCYEKGKQLFKLTGDPVWRSLFDWTRIELQVRPQRQFKSSAAYMEPIDFWGCSDWTRQIAEGALNMSVEPIQMRPTRIADHERAMRFLTAHYGKTILRQVEKLGSWERFTDDLRRRLGDECADEAA
jgi:DNA relaxase NicK